MGRRRLTVELLLDTCTFLWWATGDARVPEATGQLLRSPENDVYLSAASAWEIAIKHGLGRLPLPEAPETYVPEVRERLGIAPLPLDEDACLRIVKLPDHHRDPFDRVLVAQAIVHGLAIATPDPAIQRYPATVVWP